MNRRGAKPLLASLSGISVVSAAAVPQALSTVLDTRPASEFKASHFPEAINIPERSKSESWVGTFIEPKDGFYLVVDTKEHGQVQLEKLAKIGYEQFVKGIVLYGDFAGQPSTAFDQATFDRAQEQYFIVDVRTAEEAKTGPVFKGAHNIPLAELKAHIAELPVDKPIVVHCASGYRSAIASSLISEWAPKAQVWDIGEHIKSYKQSVN